MTGENERLLFVCNTRRNMQFHDNLSKEIVVIYIIIINYDMW